MWTSETNILKIQQMKWKGLISLLRFVLIRDNQFYLSTIASSHKKGQHLKGQESSKWVLLENTRKARLYRPCISAQESSGRFMKVFCRNGREASDSLFSRRFCLKIWAGGELGHLWWSFTGELVCWASRSEERGWKWIPKESGLAVVTTEEHYSQANQKWSQPSEITLSVTCPLFLDRWAFCLWMHNLFFSKGWKSCVHIFLAPGFSFFCFCSRWRGTFSPFLPHGDFTEIVIKTTAAEVVSSLQASNTQLVSWILCHRKQRINFFFFLMCSSQIEIIRS